MTNSKSRLVGSFYDANVCNFIFSMGVAPDTFRSLYELTEHAKRLFQEVPSLVHLVSSNAVDVVVHDANGAEARDAWLAHFDRVVLEKGLLVETLSHWASVAFPILMHDADADAPEGGGAEFDLNWHQTHSGPDGCRFASGDTDKVGAATTLRLTRERMVGMEVEMLERTTDPEERARKLAWLRERADLVPPEHLARLCREEPTFTEPGHIARLSQVDTDEARRAVVDLVAILGERTAPAPTPPARVRR